MRPFACPLLLGVALLPTAAAAGPLTVQPAKQTLAESRIAHPLHELVDRERGARALVTEAADSGAIRIVRRAPAVVPGPSPLDCLHAKHDIRLDPMSGVTDATLELKVRASGKPLSSIGLVVDQGLVVGSVSADGRLAQAQSEIYAPARIVRVDLSPALAPNETTVVRVAYAGMLECGALMGGSVACAAGRDFSYFAHQSVFPYIFDPDNASDHSLDSLTRDITLRVPAANDVVATGEKVAEAIIGDTKVSSWTIDRPLSRVFGLYAFAGKLGFKSVPGRSAPTTLVFPEPEGSIDLRLTTWSLPVLDFIERRAGAPLPFDRSLSLVRLPTEVGDPGTATFGMTLLSETYARAGDLMHEETWAHENSHLFWGIVAPEENSLESRLLSEGLATLTQIDYTYEHHFAGEDRDLYLARRFVPIGLDLRSLGKTLPPVQLASGEGQAGSFHTQAYTLWAYYKTAATLDHLRVTIGDDAFAKGLTSYVRRCSYVGCRPEDLRIVLEQASGRDLAPFFARWVTGSERPEITVSFAPIAGGADVELTRSDDAPMTVELWARLDDGRMVKKRVDLSSRTTHLRFEADADVRSVSLSPRHDLLIDARSALAGDLDFDGETDGFDILKCARLVGEAYQPNATGLWTVDAKFEPRCDVNGDFKIDDEDLATLAASFGTLRKP